MHSCNKRKFCQCLEHFETETVSVSIQTVTMYFRNADKDWHASCTRILQRWESEYSNMDGNRSANHWSMLKNHVRGKFSVSCQSHFSDKEAEWLIHGNSNKASHSKDFPDMYIWPGSDMGRPGGEWLRRTGSCIDDLPENSPTPLQLLSTAPWYETLQTEGTSTLFLLSATGSRINYWRRRRKTETYGWYLMALMQWSTASGLRRIRSRLS